MPDADASTRLADPADFNAARNPSLRSSACPIGYAGVHDHAQAGSSGSGDAQASFRQPAAPSGVGTRNRPESAVVEKPTARNPRNRRGDLGTDLPVHPLCEGRVAGTLEATGLRRCPTRPGARINEQKSGDRQLQGRIAALDENIRQAETAKQSTSAFKPERTSLILQLAAPTLGRQAPPPGAETEHQKAKEAKAAVESYEEGMKTARASLPPKDGTGWRRVGIGYGLVGCVFVLGLLLIFGSRGTQSSEPKIASGAPKSSDSPSTVSSEEQAKLQKAVAEGDALWDEGVQGVKEANKQGKSATEARAKFDDAFEKYMVVVNSPQLLSDRPVLSRVYGRVIDVALERKKNPSLAKEVAIKALRAQVLPSTSSDKASATLAAAKQELRAEDKDIDEWLAREQKHSGTTTSVDTEDMEQRYKALVNRIRPGMTREQVENILGPADEEKENDLGEFNPEKAGQILTILTWQGDEDSNSPSIILSFVNEKLQDGGTPGYDIHKGFKSK